MPTAEEHKEIEDAWMALRDAEEKVKRLERLIGSPDEALYWTARQGEIAASVGYVSVHKRLGVSLSDTMIRSGELHKKRKDSS